MGGDGGGEGAATTHVQGRGEGGGVGVDGGEGWEGGVHPRPQGTYTGDGTTSRSGRFLGRGGGGREEEKCCKSYSAINIITNTIEGYTTMLSLWVLTLWNTA